MELGAPKEVYGPKVAFLGGIPVEVLIAGTPDQTRAAVLHSMARGAPGSGFILGPSHSIAYGTKYDSFLSMLDEYVKLRDRF
jgi:hypothetical protein